jgi:hypothetical protein
MNEPTADLIHAFNTGRYATALCGMSNEDDHDAPATENWAEVTCAACLDRRPPADEYVYAIPGENHIIDAIGADGLTWVNKHTQAEVLARYPDAERYSMDDWLAAKAARQQTPITWAPTTALRYAEMLSVLPPVAYNGWSFLVGEPDDHCAATGRPRFRAYRTYLMGRARYEVASRPLTLAEFVIAREAR